MTAGSTRRWGLRRRPIWLANHPLSDAKFFFFIFALIPVQTLFTYNWLILPQYLERAFAGSFVSERFEVFSNLNPILIFIAVPIVTALTQKKKVYNMMIARHLRHGGAGLPAGLRRPTCWLLLAFLLIMTIGEAMWQPRFLQYAAEIAPEGRTGAYMGVAQFPWFLTKMLVPLYSGLDAAEVRAGRGTPGPAAHVADLRAASRWSRRSCWCWPGAGSVGTSRPRRALPGRPHGGADGLAPGCF